MHIVNSCFIDRRIGLQISIQQVAGSFKKNLSGSHLPQTTNFIKSGRPPLYIGFGSMKDKSQFKKTFDIILKALELSKQRAVVGLGWNSLDYNQSIPEEVFLIDNVPFTWLFPQMAAVVHHGGAGTTANRSLCR